MSFTYVLHIQMQQIAYFLIQLLKDVLALDLMILLMN